MESPRRHHHVFLRQSGETALFRRVCRPGEDARGLLFPAACRKRCGFSGYAGRPAYGRIPRGSRCSFPVSGEAPRAGKRAVFPGSPLQPVREEGSMPAASMAARSGEAPRAGCGPMSEADTGKAGSSCGGFFLSLRKTESLPQKLYCPSKRRRAIRKGKDTRRTDAPTPGPPGKNSRGPSPNTRKKP